MTGNYPTTSSFNPRDGAVRGKTDAPFKDIKDMLETAAQQLLERAGWNADALGRLECPDGATWDAFGRNGRHQVPYYPSVAILRSRYGGNGMPTGELVAAAFASAKACAHAILVERAGRTAPG